MLLSLQSCTVVSECNKLSSPVLTRDICSSMQKLTYAAGVLLLLLLLQVEEPAERKGGVILGNVARSDAQ